MKLQTIQNLINKKAEDKLAEDIKSLSDMIIGHPLITNEGPKLQTEAGENMPMRPRQFFHPGGGFFSALFDHHLPKYIQDETNGFMEKVNRMEAEEVKVQAPAPTWDPELDPF